MRAGGRCSCSSTRSPFDPWIDVLLGRVPHSFIDPGGHGHQAVALISDLAAGLGDRDALIIFS
jgi:hypothetical protein